MFRSMLVVDLAVLLFWCPLLLLTGPFFTSSSTLLCQARAIDHQSDWGQHHSASRRASKEPRKKNATRMANLEHDNSDNDDEVPAPYAVTEETGETASGEQVQSDQGCETHSFSQNVAMSLFAFVITCALLAFFSLVFCNQNGCTCAQLVDELKDNLTLAGFTTMTSERKQEYIYKKRQKRLGSKGLRSLMAEHKGSDEIGFSARFWHFFKKKRPQGESISDSPFGSATTISTESLREYDKS